MPSKFLIDGPANSAWTIALAHGAGAGMDAPFMEYFALALAGHGYRVARFEFPYMASRRQGKRRPPDREAVLRQAWLDVVTELHTPRLVIGGKSMGGRIASLVAEEAEVAGLICLGYPFHPVGKPTQLRVEHLRTLQTPTLFLQGTRDPFGTREEVMDYTLSTAIRVKWLEDGDHSFKPRRASGKTERQNWDEAVGAIHHFVASLAPSSG